VIFFFFFGFCFFAEINTVFKRIPTIYITQEPCLKKAKPVEKKGDRKFKIGGWFLKNIFTEIDKRRTFCVIGPG